MIKRTTVILLAALILVIFAGTAAANNVEINRIWGDTRYETAVEVSREGWERSDVVLLARGDEYADALAGAPLAYQYNAPILLTSTNTLTASTGQEIKRLQATTVIILGGTGAVSGEVEQALKNSGYAVERIAGADRYDTAARIADRIQASEAVIAFGSDFRDALLASPYAARAGIPVLLTRSDSLPSYTKARLEGMAGVTVAGSTSAVSSSVFAELPDATRVHNAGHYSNAIALAGHYGNSADHIFIATGKAFADAMTGTTLAAANNSGIFLVDDHAPLEIIDYIKERDIQQVTILGGPGAVSEAVEDDLRTAKQERVDVNAELSANLLPAGGGRSATITVTVAGSGGRPVEDVNVSFFAEATATGEDRNGQLSSAQKSTDASGKAAVTYTTLKQDDNKQIAIKVAVNVNDVFYEADLQLLASNSAATVEGLVSDPFTGEPRPEAMIFFENLDLNRFFRGRTGADGRYVAVLPTGKYRSQFNMTTSASTADIPRQYSGSHYELTKENLWNNINHDVSKAGKTYTVNYNKGICKGVITNAASGQTLAVIPVVDGILRQGSTELIDLAADRSFMAPLTAGTYRVYIMGRSTHFATVSIKAGQINDIGGVRY